MPRASCCPPAALLGTQREGGRQGIQHIRRPAVDEKRAREHSGWAGLHLGPVRPQGLACCMTRSWDNCQIESTAHPPLAAPHTRAPPTICCSSHTRPQVHPPSAAPHTRAHMSTHHLLLLTHAPTCPPTLCCSSHTRPPTICCSSHTTASFRQAASSARLAGCGPGLANSCATSLRSCSSFCAHPP